MVPVVSLSCRREMIDQRSIFSYRLSLDVHRQVINDVVPCAISWDLDVPGQFVNPELNLGVGFLQGLGAVDPNRLLFEVPTSKSASR